MVRPEISDNMQLFYCKNFNVVILINKILVVTIALWKTAYWRMYAMRYRITDTENEVGDDDQDYEIILKRLTKLEKVGEYVPIE